MKKSKVIKFIIVVLMIAVACIAGTSSHVVMTGKVNISGTVREKTSLFAASEVKALSELKPDCIMVLGCGIEDQETPSGLLKDRLDAAISLYIKDVAPKLLMTGDNGSLSIPMPPVGGSPDSMALRKSSSKSWASSSPASFFRSWSSKRPLWSSGSFSSLKALASSLPHMKSSKRCV